MVLRKPPDQKSAWKWGPWSYSHMELNSASNLNVLRSRFFPELSDRSPVS